MSKWNDVVAYTLRYHPGLAAHGTNVIAELLRAAASDAQLLDLVLDAFPNLPPALVQTLRHHQGPVGKIAGWIEELGAEALGDQMLRDKIAIALQD